MKFRQEFRVSESIDKVWLFMEQPLSVANCIPGVESVELIDTDKLSVRATQRLGPMSATFEARIRITNRVAKERIDFTSTGKAIRGAAGNFYAQNVIHLARVGRETHMVVEGQASLAGVLGTIGHPVINKHAAKVTAEFSRNLEHAISHNSSADETSLTDNQLDRADVVDKETRLMNTKTTPTEGDGMRVTSDRWIKAAALFSGTATIIGLIILIRMSL